MMPRNEHLRQRRIQRNWRQKDVASQLSVSLLTVQRWEQGVQQPSSYYRAKLCDLFGCSDKELGLEQITPAPLFSDVLSEVPESSDQNLFCECSPLWTVPYGRNLYFTGREELFALLDEHLTRGYQHEPSMMRPVVLTQPQALTGLGGIGKTQLAVEYAYRAREQGHFKHIFWINAANQEAIIASFIALFSNLPGVSLEGIDQQKLAAVVKRWLERCPERWLLIFDNADDLSLLPAYIPHSDNGRVLLTTRAQAVGSLAIPMAVEKMSLVEGTLLLLRRAQRQGQVSADEIHTAEKLVGVLDYFPLALEQAGAYLEETGCTIDHYLQLYDGSCCALLARRGVQASNYPDSVATTWLLSFQRVHEANQFASQLLHLCAFLAPDHIPEELLQKGAAYWPEELKQEVTNPLTFDALLAALLRFSLIKRLAAEQQLSVHRLVQVVQIEMLSLEERRQWAERVVRAVHHLFPSQPREDVDSWPQCLRYLEQVQACAQLISQYQLRFIEAADLLDRAGTYLWASHASHASYSQAEAFYQQALHLREEVLGACHVETATSFHHLGRLYYEQGKYDEADAFYRQALAVREEQLGAWHPETAWTLNGLGVIYYEQGRYRQAEACFQRALTIQEEQLGIWHLQTSATLDNLGRLYRQQGRYNRAVPYFLRSLAISETLFGPRHPVTAEVMANLAALYRDQREYELAKPLFTRALKIQEHTLTAVHPELARTLYGFARFHEEQGALHVASDLYQRALTIREQVYGLHHLKTRETYERWQAVQQLLDHSPQDSKQIEQPERLHQ